MTPTSTRGTDAMTYLIFIGDMLVMAFMTGLVIWLSVGAQDERIAAAARIPLDDDEAPHE